MSDSNYYERPHRGNDRLSERERRYYEERFFGSGRPDEPGRPGDRYYRSRDPWRDENFGTSGYGHSGGGYGGYDPYHDDRDHSASDRYYRDSGWDEASEGMRQVPQRDSDRYGEAHQHHYHARMRDQWERPAPHDWEEYRRTHYPHRNHNQGYGAFRRRSSSYGSAMRLFDSGDFGSGGYGGQDYERRW